jgi:uncharacterized glyoxalase superfamily protein PhnB
VGLALSVVGMGPTFDAFGITVADMAAALAFYRQLGLDISAEADTQPHTDVALPGGVRLMFDTYETIRAFNPDFNPPGKSGHFSLAFRCADPADVDATYRRMVEAGHRGEREPWNAFWGQRYAILLDADGNHVDLYADLPGPPAS